MSVRVRRSEPNSITNSPAVSTAAAASINAPASELHFDNLSAEEQAVASLGIEPGQLKPIGWMNEKHYEGLKKNNSLDPEFQRRIEAHKVVSNSFANAAVNGV